MKGRTELHISQATMIEAMQMYFDSQFKDGASPTVEKVTLDDVASDYQTQHFVVVTLSEDSQPEE